MKTAHYLPLLAAAILCISCGSDNKSTGTTKNDVQDSIAPTAITQNETPTATPATAPANEFEKPVSTSPYDNVTKWVVDVTAVTTISFDITPEEATNIERGDYGKYAKLFHDYADDIFVNDIDGEYFLIYHDEVVNGTKTITNPRIVKKLNTMMQSAQYSEYASSVRINSTTAHARWYGGNRGGGISDDFPSEVARVFDF